MCFTFLAKTVTCVTICYSIKISFFKFFFLKIFRHNFLHRITPVSLLCCRSLDYPCAAFIVTSVFGVYVAPSSAHGAPSTVRDTVL
jgi:hypothetical protein